MLSACLFVFLPTLLAVIRCECWWCGPVVTDRAERWRLLWGLHRRREGRWRQHRQRQLQLFVRTPTPAPITTESAVAAAPPTAAADGLLGSCTPNRGEFSVTVSTACTRGIRSVAVETPGGTWEPCTLTAATRSAITTDTSPRTGSCTLAAPPDTSAYHTYYSSVAVYGDLGVECGRHSPVYCAVNERVQSNACVACDAGSTRA